MNRETASPVTKRAGAGVSPRKAAANAKNARRSTGPRTEAGKQRSARNATKHGGYASTPLPIHRGAFAEDPVELAEYLEAIVQSLAPCDAIERAQAQRIAQCYVRGVRLNRYEAEVLSAPRPEDLPENQADRLESKFEHWRRVQQWLTTGDETGVAFDALALDLIRFASETNRFSWLLRRPPEPIDGSDRETCETYLKVLFSHRVDAADWVAKQCLRAKREVQQQDGAVARTAEHFVAELNQLEVMRQRIARELERAQQQYNELKRRKLPSHEEEGSSRNEPTTS
jgi:hypothetical protein